jgi:hypothetical protein
VWCKSLNLNLDLVLAQGEMDGIRLLSARKAATGADDVEEGENERAETD